MAKKIFRFQHKMDNICQYLSAVSSEQKEKNCARVFEYGFNNNQFITHSIFPFVPYCAY